MMTAPNVTLLAADRVAATGHCPVCAAVGRAVLAAPGRDRCTVHLARPALLVETTRTGQARLVAPAGARRRPVYPTGVQTPCVSCASAGRDTQGLPRDGDGSEPLCIPCWRSRTEREQRRQAAELRAGVLHDVDDVVEGCAACGEWEPSPACWLCGYSWLAAIREEAALEQEAEQATAAAVVQAERVAVEVRFGQLAEITEAEQRVAELTAWVQRLREVIEAFAAGRRRGRAVVHLADLLARQASAKASKRGRPSVLARVAGVLAVDANARITRPGRLRTAELADCQPRTVTGCWARAEALEWMERTAQGRRLSMEERTRLGRTYDRAEFDLAPLGGRERAVAREPYLPVALLVIEGLLAHAVALLEAAQDDVDALHARTGAVMDMQAMARRAQLRQAVATARDTAIEGAEDLARHALNICHPRAASTGMSVYSWLVVRGSQPPTITHPRSVGPSRRENGASRSPTKRVPRSVRRPRPIERACTPSRASRRPDWMQWGAYDLARAAQRAWPWLENVPLPRVAATLGSRLGPGWTMPVLLDWIERSRGGRELLDTPMQPLGYLRSLLDESLTGNVEPPHPARRYDEHRAQVAAARRRDVVDQAAAAAAARDAARAEWDSREQARQAERAGPGAGRHAALAAARAAARGDHATARAIAADAQDWPAVAQPGAGLPSALAH
ncbi:hypothetical protein [Micromonospora sp. C31]|uniref:hypothetical protein n=1 Tax=Micromonospora sp. C31 TaxID=2824876 RepID=UPI001FFD46B6|nr:hypothetical protein [Micromonospora sp. C31]